MILDAYSSDSVPVHLVDREAMQLYLKKITSNGILMFHVSNRYLDLEPVIGNLAKDSGLVASAQSDDRIESDSENNKTPSAYVAVSKNRVALEAILKDPRWKPARVRPEIGVWTDDFSSILPIVRWR